MHVACDSVAATGALTRSGRTLFAKNSDRPAGECQPLVQAAAHEHPPGAKLRCQYLEIDQSRHTLAFVGSRPHWLWGVEHGVNERGVAIGNHTIFTREAVADVGLTGMDLVRLGLERGATAREACGVIVALVERHGQGGSGFLETSWPYHNSFLIADADDVLLLEAAGARWAVREAEGASASNHVSIAADWTRLSSGCEEHARARGWWNADGGRRFDFAAAYRDTSLVPAVVSSARYAATCAFLAEKAGSIDADAAKALLRSHGAGAEAYVPGFAPDDERAYSVCMHADPVGTTTASMVVELGAPPDAPAPSWVAFCNPCVSPYLPVFLEGRVPAEMQQGGATASSGGAWWRFKRLLAWAEEDWAERAPALRAFWLPHEREVASLVRDRTANAACAAGDARRAMLTALMDEVWVQTSSRLDAFSTRAGAAA